MVRAIKIQLRCAPHTYFDKEERKKTRKKKKKESH